MSQIADYFLELDEADRRPAAARYAVLPIPYEGTVSYDKGTAAGAQAILEASQQVELFDEELHDEFISPGIATYRAVEPADDPAEEMRRIEAAALLILRSGKFLLSLGGEHSITGPLVRAAAAVHGELSVLQIDAHADLRDSYHGTKHSHACVMRRVLDITDRICQVGIRNFSREEFQSCRRQVERFITPAAVHASPGGEWIDRAMDLLGDKVYLTVDVDGFDPGVAPGTGTPEPGGLYWPQVTGLLRRLCAERQVVAADINEVRPLSGNRVTEFMAARLGYKIIAYTQLRAC
jgi:agmatinase